MIIYQKRDNDNNNSTSCFSKVKSFKKSHPFLFYGIIVGIIIIIIIIILLCLLLRKKEIKEDLPPSNNDIPEPIFPLPEDSKSEVINIYDNIENNDDGTLTQFCEYLSQNGTNLKDEQKVYLAYHWVVENIQYNIFGELLGYESDPEIFFSSKTTCCSGYTRLFKKLLLCMNYPESKIKII